MIPIKKPKRTGSGKRESVISTQELENKSCPVCGGKIIAYLEKMPPDRTKEHRYYIRCERVHSHFHGWIYDWPDMHITTGLNLNNWVFNEQDILCPECGDEMFPEINKKGFAFLCKVGIGKKEIKCRLNFNDVPSIKWKELTALIDKEKAIVGK